MVSGKHRSSSVAHDLTAILIAVTLAISPSSPAAALADPAVSDTETQVVQNAETQIASDAEAQVGPTGMTASQAQAEDEAQGAGTLYAAGEVLVTFADGTDAMTATEILDDVATVESTDVDQDDLDAAVPVITVATDDTATVADAVAELEQDPGVESAQPNYIYYPMEDDADDPVVTLESAQSALMPESTTINDPYANPSLSTFLQAFLLSVGCYDAWDSVRCDNAVTIAVIDTGCLTTHADLKANIVAAYNSVSEQTGTAYVADNFDHGTHVCGIAAACTNNSVGGSGTSYNANLLPIKAYTDGAGFYDDDLIKAYNYLLSANTTDLNGDGTVGATIAKEYNVRVVNMSLGGPGKVSATDALMVAIDSAYSEGILTVCAAGNSGTYDGVSYTPPFADTPADYATCVSVINITASNVRSSTSNYNVAGTTEGDFGKNICAPGVSIYSTTKDGTYGYKSGTSMASPVVAGIAAMVFAADESLTADQVKRILYSSATDLGTTGWDVTYGYGKVNAYRAVKEAEGLLIHPADCTAGDTTYTGEQASGNVSVVVKGKALTPTTDYTVSYSDATNVGMATATITGAGSSTAGYIGTVEKQFAIAPASLASATVTLPSSSITYTGRSLEPDPIVTWNGAQLVKGEDYTVSYTNNIHTGTATVTVTGIGNFTGDAPQTSFEIAKASDNSVAVTPYDGDYDGSPHSIIATAAKDGSTLYYSTVEPAAASYADWQTTNPAFYDAGTYTVYAKALNPDYTDTAAVPSTVTIHTTWTRLAGDNRYATAALTSRQGFPEGSSTIILARGDDFPDALAAASLAGAADCPIITTSSTSLSSDALSEIERLEPTKAYILGGSGSISQTTESELRSIGIAVTRIEGTDRVDTACLVALASNSTRTAAGKALSDTCIIAKGWAYADALAVAPYAYTSGSPVFLANEDGSLSDEVVQAIADGGYTKAIVLGGEHSATDASGIANSTMDSLETTTSVIGWIRLAGSNRYATAELIATWACGDTTSAQYAIQPTGDARLTYSRMAIARGDDFPDALASVDALGPSRSTLLLVAHDATDEDTHSRITRVVGGNAVSIDGGYIIGGIGSVNSTVEEWTRAATE